MTNEKPITLSREDLYELAWSKPITQLAQDFGISDVALAKRCRRLGIPLPGRGYWARVDAGQNPYRPKLPKREPQWSDESSLTVGPATGAYSASILSSAESKQALCSASPGSIPAQIETLAIVPSKSVVDVLPLVKRTAIHHKHPQRSELSLPRGERAGPMIAIDVTSAVLDRALLLADTLIRAASALGWLFDEPGALRSKQKPTEELAAEKIIPVNGSQLIDSNSNTGRLLVENEQIAFQIEERFRDEPVTPTATQLARERREYGYRAPRRLAVPTGALRVVRVDTYHSYGTPDRRSWYDRKGRLVEDQIPDVLLGFYELALSIRERREKAEREARAREEVERARKEQEAISEANQKLIAQLETDAGAWNRARYLRRYIRAARRALGDERLPVRFRTETIDYLSWAERYADELDPLTNSVRSGDFAEVSSYRFHNDLERMTKSLGRLSGADWIKAFKLGEDYSPEPEADRTWPYREKSVFEVSPAMDGNEEG